MEIVDIEVNKIKPYKKNAKKHDTVQIANVAESIKQFGFVQPLVLDKDNVVVIGHCRLAAAKKLRMKTVPCVYVDTLSAEQVAKLRLLDNKLNESAWNMDLIAAEIADLDFDGFDIDWGIGDDKKKKEQEEGEVPFTEELLLSHNYIVLYFDNDFDWEVAQDKFKLREVKDLIPRKSQPTGIGRVINGKDILKWKEN